MKEDLLLEKLTLQVSGMTCSACAYRIEKSLEKMNGIGSVFVNLAMETAYIRYSPVEADIKGVLDRFSQLGFRAVVPGQGDQESSGRKHSAGIFKSRFFWSALFTLPLLWPMLHHFSWTSDLWVPSWLQLGWVQLLLATPVQFVWGWPFLEGAYRALRNGYANMDVLVALGTLTAYLYSHYLVFNPMAGHVGGHIPLYFETSATIITVIWFGKWMEAKARQNVSQSQDGLRLLLPTSVRKIQNGQEEVIEAVQIRQGDEALVNAGEMIPVDGIVAEGSGLVDESALTGESIPHEKIVGAKVSAGTRMLQGRLKVKVERAGRQTLLGQIMRSLEETQSIKPSIKTKADLAAAWFVPIVIGLAGITFAYWYWIASSSDLGMSLKYAIAVVICACPCAIGLATPLSVFIATKRAAELGISFRSSEALEALSRTNTILFDKTGTLTRGIPIVTDLEARTMPSEELLRLMATAERDCEHPAAGALVREAGRQGIKLNYAQKVQEMPGFGVEAHVEGKHILIGTNRLLKNNGVKNIPVTATTQWEQQGKTVMHIAVNGEWAGAVAVMDTLRPGTAAAIRRLKKQGIRLSLITGDSYNAAQYTATQCGIDDFRAGMLPQEKMDHVKNLRQQGHRVMLVGDGMNDAPAMASANIGVSVHNATNAAKEAGDLQLFREDSNTLVDALVISRKTVVNIRQNLAFAFVYNAIILPSAMLGHVEPWAAGAAMTLSSLTVVLNAWRLKHNLKRRFT